jgi:hypothetical protein
MPVQFRLSVAGRQKQYLVYRDNALVPGVMFIGAQEIK